MDDWVVSCLGFLLIDKGALEKKTDPCCLKLEGIVLKRHAEPRVSIRRVPYNKHATVRAVGFTEPVGFRVQSDLPVRSH